VKAGLHRGWGARLARRFLRHERGSISPLFALMLIPICGMMAMAVELGNGVLQQRAQQHAADSSALAAATGNNVKCYDASGNQSGTANSVGVCTTTGYTPGYQLEAKAVAASFPTISGATVTPAAAYCPGTVTGSYDCYKVTISRNLPFFIGQVIGVSNMTPTAVAYARISEHYDLCFATNNDFTTDGTSTGFSTCYVESFNGTIKCTSVTFAGLFASNDQACNGTNLSAPGTKPTCPTVQQGVNPCLSGSIPNTSTVPCQSAANQGNPASWTWTPVTTSYTPSSGTAVTSTTNYVRLCAGTLTLGSNWSIAAASNNQAIILDNTTLDGSGGAYSFTALGTTVISTCSSTCTGGSLPVPFQNVLSGNGTIGVKIGGPEMDTGTFANFALYDDETQTTAGALNFSFNIDIDGEIYEPNRDLTLSGSQYSNIGGISCTTLIAKSFYSNGGKLANNPIADCAGNYLTAQQTVANVALVK
jgi:Flp pilus assembly protein TadG